jgi:hypothetical protein
VEIIHGRHGHAAHAHDQISRDDPRSARRTARLDAGDEDGARRRKVISIRLASGEMNRLPETPM